jgi:hypothetical protein
MLELYSSAKVKNKWSHTYFSLICLYRVESEHHILHLSSEDGEGKGKVCPITGYGGPREE